jgi:outer membrane protein, heavy metal efflux system
MRYVYHRIPTAALGTVLALCLWVSMTAAAQDAGAMGANFGVLTMEEAFSRVLGNNPELAAHAEEIRAREAEALQAGLRPNPVLSLEAENLLGSGDLAGTGLAETTLTVRQAVELGGKRFRRRELAETETFVGLSDYHLTRADVLARTEEWFITVLAAQQRLEMVEELTALAERIAGTVEERIAAGSAAATEVIRARIQWLELKSLQKKSYRELVAARSHLAASMGQETADFHRVAGELAQAHDLPGLAELEGLIEKSPDVARQAAEIDNRRRSLKLAQALRYPDLEVGIGTRYLAESKDTALVLGVSVPLPIFNRNQGPIASARSRLAKAEAEERNAFVQAKAALIAAWQEMDGALGEAETLQNEIIPASRQALAAAEHGYQAGKFPIFDVLDAQRILVEAQRGHLDALVNYQRAYIEIKRLLGRVPPSSNSIRSFSAFKE